MTTETDDEARWREAQSILDRVPTESADQRLRRWRRIRLLVAVALLLATVAAAIVVAILLRSSSGRGPADVPTWQSVTGAVIACAGVLLQVFGAVVLWRDLRRQRAWRSPLAVLTPQQRKLLLNQVRGRRTVEFAHVPLGRVLAEQQLGQRGLMASTTGLAVAFIGQWVVTPTAWRAGLALTYAVFMALAWGFVQRDAQRARDFLAHHPTGVDLQAD